METILMMFTVFKSTVLSYQNGQPEAYLCMIYPKGKVIIDF